MTIPTLARPFNVRDRLACLRFVRIANAPTDSGRRVRIASNTAILAGASSLTIASAETDYAAFAVPSLSYQVLGTSRAAAGSSTTRRVQAANSPMVPTL